MEDARGISLAILIALCAFPSTAAALSEIQREDTPPGPSEVSPREPLPPLPGVVPLPGETPVAPPDAEETPETPTTPDGEQDSNQDAPPVDSGLPAPVNDPAAPIPPIQYDVTKLPEPVRRMHGLILSACRTGKLEALRPLLGSGETATQITFGEIEGDPISFLRNLSGDAEGSEILAIIEEVLSAGFVHLDAGTDEELYVWPYFFAIPLEKLEPRQRVELFKIITGGDYEEMNAYGGYTFYRVGITPQGEWVFFVAGN